MFKSIDEIASKIGADIAKENFRTDFATYIVDLKEFIVKRSAFIALNLMKYLNISKKR